MDLTSHNEGSSKKKGLARRAKNHTLSNSLSNLHVLKGKSDGKDGEGIFLCVRVSSFVSITVVFCYQNNFQMPQKLYECFTYYFFPNP